MAVSTIEGIPQSVLPAGSRLTGYDKKLRIRAQLTDIYVNLTGLYRRSGQAIPNAIYMTLDEMGQASNEKITVTMKLPLSGGVITGNRRLLGNEVAPTTKNGSVYRNNYKFAVRTETYNTRELDQRAYGLFDMHVKDLGTHAAQFEGYQIRQAIIKKYPQDMIDGDLAGVISQQWNPNVFVAGATDANQPSYDTDNQNFINNIVASMYSVGGELDNVQAGAPTFRMMNKIALSALNKKLMPLEIEGQQAFVLVVSPQGASMFADPTMGGSGATTSMGQVWVDFNRLSEKVQNWYGIIGKFVSSIGVCLYVVVDVKCPSCEPGGSSAPYTLTPRYMIEGDIDNRQNTTSGETKNKDVGVLLGKGALVKWEPEKLHMVKHEDDYGRILGTGYAGVRGVQRLEFDATTATNTSREYYGSMLVFMDRYTY